ncbi:MAG: cytochrome c oxidase assembly protein [Gammaproteobacteria bacterium]|nr:MAG: cytochrome c oxidase assembly protein [Gammaproteobacteria bacterium]TDJ37787.1 MAG: cytochrome c oxidase assembly protein [Gammaproteobacteria bacterium]
MTETRNSQRKSVILLVSLALGMFGFAYALVPLYEVFCEVTGFNGKTSSRAADPANIPDARLASSDREVTIQFLAHVANGMPWEFRPTEHQLRVRLGEINTTHYYARNRAAQAVTGQAVPSVSPGYAAKYLHKVECFCFTQQHLEAGEEQEMPVRFYLDAELPEEVHTLSLSYTLFKVPDRVPQRVPDRVAVR